jgi:hypothetical protein
MKIDLQPDEAQALLDGVNVVIKQKARDLAFFSEALALDNPERQKILTELGRDLSWAKSAREKIQKVR